MPQPTGPFSQYLTESFRPATPQPTGAENGLGQAAYYANAFLDGIKQARLHKAATQEAEQEKDRQAYQIAIQTIQNNPDILPARKNEWITKLTQGLISQVAGTKESSKDTGNPITDYAKSVALNLTGGALPKKGAPLDRNLLAEVLTGANNPTNTIGEVTNQAEKFFTQAVSDLKSRGVSTQEEVLSHPELVRMLSTVRNSTGNAEWMPTALTGVMQFWPKDKTALSAQQAEIAKNTAITQASHYWNQDAQGAAPTTQPPPGAQPATPAPAAGAAPTQATTQAAPSILSSMMKGNQSAKLAGMPELHKIGNPEEMLNTQTGQLMSVIPFTSSRYGQGVVDARTGAVITEPLRKATANDRNRPSPERIEELFNKINTQLVQAVGNEEAKAWSGVIRSNLETGDERGAGDVIAKALDLRARKDDAQARRQEAAARLAQAGQQNSSAIITRLGDQYDKSIPVKNMETAERYALSAHDAYNSTKKDPANAGLADFELMRTWAKLTDMMTGVREGEYRDIGEMLGKFRKFGVNWDSIWNQNGNRLDDSARKAILTSIDNITMRTKEQHDRYANGVRDRAQQMGVDPNLIVDPGRFNPGASPQSNPAQTAAPPRRRSGPQQSAQPGGIGAAPPRRRSVQSNQLAAPNL